MTKAEYTKGEWIKQGAFIFSSERPPRLIAEVIRSNMSFLKQQANAHLISAAPDMHKALKQAIRTFEAHGIRETDPRYLMITQTLAKAEGKNE